MKRISILLIAFLLLGSFAFAEDISGDIETTFELTGDASATFGVDLEEGTTGFRNALRADLFIQFVPEQTAELDGDGWYGWVEVEDFALAVGLETTVNADSDPSWDATSVGSVTARVTDGIVYIQIYAAPDRKIADFAQPIDGTWLVETVTAGGTTGNAEQGIILGYGDGPVNDLSLRVFSFGDWTDNEENAYGVAVNADVEVDIIQIEAGVSVGPFGEDVDDEDVVTGLGGKLTVDMTDDADVGLSAYVGADVQMFDDDGTVTIVLDPDDDIVMPVAVDETTTFIDLAAGLQYGIVPAGDPTNVALDFYLGQAADLDDADEDYGWVGDLELSFYEDTDGGLAPAIGAGVSVKALNLLAPAFDDDIEDWDPATMGNVNASFYPLTLVIGANLEYDLAGLNPFTEAEFRTAFYDDSILDSDWIDDQDPGLDFLAGISLGADLHGITRTTFTLQYEGIELVNEDLREQYLTFETGISW